MTAEGWDLWALVQRLTGQIRHLAAADRAVATGWDMAAALAMAGAMGIPVRLAAEVLPEVEAVAMAAMNEREA